MPVEGRSSNHFELAFTESEFLLDFGQSYDEKQEGMIHTRIILTPLAAKTLLTMLHELVDQYEQKVAPIDARRK